MSGQTGESGAVEPDKVAPDTDTEPDGSDQAQNTAGPAESEPTASDDNTQGDTKAMADTTGAEIDQAQVDATSDEAQVDGDAELELQDDAQELVDGEDLVSDDDLEEFDDEFDDATCAERVLETCLRAIVDAPDEIDIEVDEHDRRMVLHVRVAADDMGKIIGKRGRVANALRTLVKAAGARDGLGASVEIDD